VSRQIQTANLLTVMLFVNHHPTEAKGDIIKQLRRVVLVGTLRLPPHSICPRASVARLSTL
jgi:hypothetical protein